MHIGIYNYYEIFNKNNSIFNPDCYKTGENLEHPLVLLRKKLLEMGISLDTLDIRPIEEYQKIIFLDLPRKKSIDLLKLKSLNIDLYLIICESEIIKHDNWDTKNHKYFKKIFTWNDEWVDNKKYFKYFLSNKIPEVIKFDNSHKTDFCALIAGNKMNFDKRELYSERLRAIEWFEKNHPNELDIFGFDWNKGIRKEPFRSLSRNKLTNKVLNIFEKFGPVAGFTRKMLKNNKGPIKSKKDILSSYKFSISYENVQNITGYISEKIFDSFLAGCVPVYLGAPNITEYIPANTFIDKRNFKAYDDLYNYMKNMSEKEYSNFLQNMRGFLCGGKAHLFSAEYFSETIIRHII